MERKIESKAEMLEALRAFLTNMKIPYEDRREVWDILAGLRGPDYDGPLKEATTAVIRQAVLGHHADAADVLGVGAYVYGSMVNQDHEGYVRRRKDAPPSHFLHHAMRAFAALGLKWGERNEPR